MTKLTIEQSFEAAISALKTETDAEKLKRTLEMVLKSLLDFSKGRISILENVPLFSDEQAAQPIIVRTPTPSEHIQDQMDRVADWHSQS